MLDNALKLREGVEETVVAFHDIYWSDWESKQTLGHIKRRFDGDSNQCPPKYKLEALPFVSPWSFY
jgi:hypothetical protein